MIKKRPTPSQEYLLERLRYDADTGKCYWKPYLMPGKYPHRWSSHYAGKEAGNISPFGRREIAIDNIKFQIHRIIWKMIYGVEPPDQIDHIDLDPLNNRLSNLRASDNSQNNCNKPLQCNNTSGYKGVTWHKKNQRWIAEVWHHRKKYFLGCYATKEEAAEAYAKAANELHGDFVRIS